MYLFTRRARVAPGDVTRSMAWAASITEHARQVSGLDISLFSAVMGPGVGTLAWTAFVPDLVTLETAEDKLAADPAYLADVAAGAEHAPGGADDRLLRVVHPDPAVLAGGERPEIGYATVVDAVAASAQALPVAVEIARRNEAVTGIPTLVLQGVTGTWGAVTWITGYPDLPTLERAQAALASDAEWVELIDRARKVFSADATVTTALLYRRIG